MQAPPVVPAPLQPIAHPKGTDSRPCPGHGAQEYCGPCPERCGAQGSFRCFQGDRGDSQTSNTQMKSLSVPLFLPLLGWNPTPPFPMRVEDVVQSRSP